MRRLFRRHKSPASDSASDQVSTGSSNPSIQASHLAPYAGSNLPLRDHIPGKNTSLGLHLIHLPSTASCLDIVFVHGLGGDSRKTWSEDHNPALFWPVLWLPLETEFECARLFTFGYNANFGLGVANSTANITDFAKELLSELRYGRTDEGKRFGIGETPLILVTHSMGGLLAKKACILGQNDEHYGTLIRSISAIVFLSTPHRGSNLAEVLNRILVVSFQSARDFITDLGKSSMALEEINEQFRHIAPQLTIWSFYETLPTPIGPKKMMVLDKDSAILGYPEEISRPLYADHHGVCKFSSRGDANYVSVRNALGMLAEEITSKMNVFEDQAQDDARTLQRLPSTVMEQDDDLNKYHRLRMAGTCEWILRENGMHDWLSAIGGCHLVWFSAAPASGKSVLSAYVVTALQQRSHAPQYFFFNFGDQRKRSVADMLRSIACQVGKENRAFRHALTDLANQGLRIDTADAPVIWHRVYENLLFNSAHRRPLFWVIDALDECDSPKLLLDLIRTCSDSKVPLRIFITSRQMESIEAGIVKAARSLCLTRLVKESSDHNTQDIQCLVQQETGQMRGGSQIKELVTRKILARAEGNFLWTRLVLEEISHCHTASDIEETLDEFPSGMQKLYERMEHIILNLPRKSSRLLAKALLRLIMGARRPMSLPELSQALEPDFPEILDLKKTIPEVCGHFLRVDASDHVAMIHQTARDYLVQPRESELFIDERANHEALCVKTILALVDSRTTSDMIDNVDASQPYLLYAAASWMYHLKASKSNSAKVLNVLTKFFEGAAFPLWVHILSRTGHVEILVKSSKNIASFVARVRKEEASKNPLLRSHVALQVLDQWATDLLKIVAKFSTSLLKYPRAIYGLISPFSPETSVLHQQPYCRHDRDICVVGDLDNAWTDRLARVPLPEGFEAYKLACAGRHVAVLGAGANGRIIVWETQGFIKVCGVDHGEPITSIAFNAQGNKLAATGLQSTKLWAIPSGEILHTINNNTDARAIAISFTTNDTRVLAGFNDRAVRFFDVESNEREWRHVHPKLFKGSLTAGAAANSPACIAFSKDGSYAGVSYRDFPLSVWSLKNGECISGRGRVPGTSFSTDQHATGWRECRRFVWNPVTDHLIGSYAGGSVFKWHPLTGEHQETQAWAQNLAASSDGRLFLTSTSAGAVQIWSFFDFSVVYQLSSDDLLVDIAFSPDCLRFFDLRYGTVNSLNAWEPNSLLRFSDAESELASETTSSFSLGQASEANLEQFEAISALAISPHGKYVCVGTEDGSVQLRSTSQPGTIEICKFNNFMEVSHLAWGQDSQYMAAADLVGDIILGQIDISYDNDFTETTQMLALTKPKIDLNEQAIHEILFNQDSTLLLVVTSQSGHIWSLKDASLCASENLGDANLRKWVSHPSHQELLLGIGSADVRVFGWQDLLRCREPVSYLQIPSIRRDDTSVTEPKGDGNMATELLKPADILESGSNIEKVKAMVTQDLKNILVQVSSSGPSTGFDRFFVLPLAQLERIRASIDQSDAYLIKPTMIPDNVRAQVRIALAILPNDRFVFLDHELWVSSYDMLASTDHPAPQSIPAQPSRHYGNEGNEPIRRHYFIPDDWAMSGSLQLCCMTADGTLIYPRDGKVSMIKADLNKSAYCRGSSAF
ncbi:MAG: hypothetical protein Q9168_005231 [Polycauliona sp. 1 TL-2023]